ncbi:MAG: hypothetical protein K6E75_03065 [Lachnospiraceae bacterium]|nr:hypothetical protein [Lachnospiraceae bacterium]
MYCACREGSGSFVHSKDGSLHHRWWQEGQSPETDM